MIRLLFLSMAIIAADDIVVPTTFGPSNRARIVVNMVGRNNRSRMLENAQMYINTVRSTRPRTSGDYGFAIPSVTGESAVFLRGTSYSDQIPYDTDISVGYGSEFFALIGSIMLIPPVERHGTEGSMILNPSDVANQYCFEGILDYVGIDPTNPIVETTFDIVHRIAMPGGRVVHQAFPHNTVLRYQLAAENPYISLPSAAFMDLMNQISGATLDLPQAPIHGTRRTWIFPPGRCTTELISRMPTLKFTIRNAGQAGVEIHLEPLDYLRVDRRLNSCEILIVSERSSIHQLGAPFFRIAAIHFDQNRIGFCDPI